VAGWASRDDPAASRRTRERGTDMETWGNFRVRGLAGRFIH
jgi:hypothetical protein